MTYESLMSEWTEEVKEKAECIAQLEAENAKLRELLEEVIGDSVDECDLWRYRDRLRELGVEVD